MKVKFQLLTNADTINGNDVEMLLVGIALYRLLTP